jgi:hypothetical protein
MRWLTVEQLEQPSILRRRQRELPDLRGDVLVVASPRHFRGQLSSRRVAESRTALDQTSGSGADLGHHDGDVVSTTSG